MKVLLKAKPLNWNADKTVLTIELRSPNGEWSTYQNVSKKSIIKWYQFWRLWGNG